MADAPAGTPAATVTQPEDYENVFFTNDALPASDTNIGNIIITTTADEHRQRAIDFYSFLTNAQRQLAQMNVDELPRTAVIGIPGSCLVKVVYGLGLGVSAIGQESPLDSKVLMLHGDGNQDIGVPQPLVLPLDTLDLKDVATMTEEQFTTTVTVKGAEFQHPLLASARVLGTQSILKLAPIPTNLVYDGLNKDLHAGLILERIMSIETEGIEMFTHLKHFLRACLSAHTMNQNKPFISQEHLVAPPVNQARVWARNKFKTLFPNLVPGHAAPPAQIPGPNPELAAILAQLVPLQQQAIQLQLDRTNRGRGNDDEEKKDEDSIILGMSRQELQSTLIMCGKDPNDHHSLLPQWFQDCAEKGMTEAYRLCLIRKHIMVTYKYDDAEIPITSTLLKNINKRNWLGKDGNIKRPSLINACEGISPFVVLDLDEDEVAKINETEDALTRASTVTIQDITNLKKKQTPKIPASAEDFMLLLKRFANLLVALFSEDCPFFKCIEKIIKALKEFSRPARNTMTQMTKASILWIILLQSRNFALGDDTILSEFSAMHANLSSKQGNIFHAEVPQALLSPVPPTTLGSNKRKSTTPETEPDKPIAKKPRQNLNNWHPTLKEKLTIPMTKAGFPTFTTIMQYVDKDPNEVISDRSSWCTPNAFFGRCFLGEKCKRQHKIVTDVQADKIVKMMDKFITNPEDVRKG